MKGIFITIEGMDGAGKSTQIRYMKQFFEERGFQVLLTREPGGTIIGEKIRELVLDKNHQEMSEITEALLYAASRAQHVKETILPAINMGIIVLCDRYVDSSLVYQGKGRGLGYEAIKMINDFATCCLAPDLTILFDIAPELSLKRINVGEDGDRLEREAIDFHLMVHSAYMELSEMYPNRIKVVKANRSIEDIRIEVEGLLKQILEGGI